MTLPHWYAQAEVCFGEMFAEDGKVCMAYTLRATHPERGPVEFRVCSEMLPDEAEAFLLVAGAKAIAAAREGRSWP